MRLRAGAAPTSPASPSAPRLAQGVRVLELASQRARERERGVGDKKKKQQRGRTKQCETGGSRLVRRFDFSVLGPKRWALAVGRWARPNPINYSSFFFFLLIFFLQFLSTLVLFRIGEGRGEEMKEATSSGGGGGGGAGVNDPRQPSTARQYTPPKLSPQDLPIDYAGFLAVVFGVLGVMLRVRYLDSISEASTTPSTTRRSRSTLPVCFAHARAPI